MVDKITIDRAVVEQALNALDSLVARNRLNATEYEARSNALRAALENHFNPDWDQVEALKECLREHMAEIQRLRAALEHEPIAWANINKQGDITHTSNKKMHWAKTPIYLHPQPPRQPLTNEQIKLIDDCTLFHESWDWPLRFARAIEAAHGIKEQE